MNIRPIKKINISDEIASQIKKLIQDGYFKFGEKLPSERELCEKFKVSRTSIREGLEVLSGQCAIDNSCGLVAAHQPRVIGSRGVRTHERGVSNTA